MTPDVSIILPTYNRADVLMRAVHSVLAQTHADWELIVVDDGSSDGSAALLDGLDGRIRVIRQANQGVYGARNTGLSASTGRHIAFMDSDDEWLPHFLSLTLGYLARYPEAQWVSTEFWEDRGDGTPLLRHDRSDIADIYAPFARFVGVRALRLPPDQTDDYLRVYASREPLGDWARALPWPVHPHLEAVDPTAVPVYRGPLFEAMRWGYLHWLPCIVLTRHALEVVGPFTTHTRSAADYRFICQLARHFTAHMIALPSAIKYDKAAGQQDLAQGHLATGAGGYRFMLNKLGFYDELYWQARPRDADIDRLGRHFCLDAGLQALQLGHRDDALVLLRRAACAQPRLWRAGVYLAALRGSRGVGPALALLRLLHRLGRARQRLRDALRGLSRPGRRAPVAPAMPTP